MPIYRGKKISMFSDIHVTSGGLPELNNPADASDILLGKEAVDEHGDKLTGTLEICDSVGVEEVTSQTGAIDIEINSSKDSSSKTLRITDSAFNPSNIKTGVEMFGITGTFTNDSDTVADVKASLREDVVAYARGQSVGGEMPDLYNGDFSVSEQQGELIVTAEKDGFVPSGRNVVENLMFGEIDENFVEENIKSGVAIFGVTGTLNYIAEATRKPDTKTTDIVKVGSTYYLWE